jgi:hypothetical protein
MTEVRQQSTEEPIGIVISRGSRDEAPPRFWAYVYAQAPETNPGPGEVKAA